MFSKHRSHHNIIGRKALKVASYFQTGDLAVGNSLPWHPRPIFLIKMRLYSMLHWGMHAKPLFAPIIFYGALIATIIFGLQLFAAMDFVTLGILCAIGWFLWTFEEYAIHRFLLHHPRVPRFFEEWHEHTPHHQAPQDPELMVYRLADSLIFFSCNFILLWGATLHLRLALGLLAGVMCGYLFYEFAHWGSHFCDRKSVLGKLLFDNHWRHHFENPNRNFGFTTPLWDWVFGTR